MFTCLSFAYKLYYKSLGNTILLFGKDVWHTSSMAKPSCLKRFLLWSWALRFEPWRYIALQKLIGRNILVRLYVPILSHPQLEYGLIISSFFFSGFYIKAFWKCVWHAYLEDVSHPPGLRGFNSVCATLFIINSLPLHAWL